MCYSDSVGVVPLRNVGRLWPRCSMDKELTPEEKFAAEDAETMVPLSTHFPASEPVVIVRVSPSAAKNRLGGIHP